MKTNPYYILLFLSLLSFQFIHSQDLPKKSLPKQKIVKDSISKKAVDTLIVAAKDSLLLRKRDSIVKDSIKRSETIKDKIIHDAKDYILQDAKQKKVTLYNKAHVIYDDIDLKAGIIIVDYKKNTLYAKGIKDSTGYVQRPVFKQGTQETEQDSLIYNFKTRKALIYNLKTDQNGIITYGDRTKRMNDSTIFIRKIRFTTSKKKIPDYYIATDKAKLVPGKKIIIGLSNLVIADVPTPIALPFAYLPLGDKRSSGFIIPTYGDSNSQGFFLQNGGYYFALNDYFDLTLLGDVYTNGSWGLHAQSNYVVRYKYSGNFNIRFENVINSIKGLDDFSRANNFNLQWTHTQDSKSSPNSRFSASVNMGSSRYFRESLNEFNNSQYLTNTLNSSVSYYKKFVGTPFNMNITATHTQNTNTGDVNMTFPSLQLNMDRINPFAGKGNVQKNAFQKIGVNYSLQGQYLIRTKDSLFLTKEMFRTARSGVQHNVNIGTSMKVLKYFTLAPTATYREVWNFDYLNKRFDPLVRNSDGVYVGELKTDTIRGFRSFREYSTALSLTTNIYGIFNINRGRLKSIRHTMRPSISYSYRPDFAQGHNRTIQRRANPIEFETYSPFQNGIYGSPSAGISNAVTFSINNVLEAKVASKDSTETKDKKITLLNNLNVSATYNFAADSLRWSTIGINGGTRLFKDKLNLNFGATLDPYQVNAAGVRINKFNPGFPRLTNANMDASFTLSSRDLGKQKDDTKKSNNRNTNVTPDVFGGNLNDVSNRLTNNNAPPDEKSKTKKAKLYQASIPWSISFIYRIDYFNNGINSGIGNNSLMFNGDLELSPKWKVGFSSGYDFKQKGFTYTQLRFSRDLDSWRFNFNWVPFGTRSSYYFFIGVKSSVLSDLKWDKRSVPDRVLF